MKIMCHVGPWSAQQYPAIANAIFPGAEVVVISGHKRCDETGMASRYYDFLKASKGSNGAVSDNDLDMIKRCRLLRAIELELARKHLDSMRLAISEAFDAAKPDLVLSETIDSFLMDLIYAECIKRNIKFIGLVPSFINGYFRVTARGEYNRMRGPSAEEVNRVLSLLEEKNYHPMFLVDSRKNPYFSVIKRWARNLIKPPYFMVKRAISGERFNYHYWATQIVSMQWFHILPRLNLGNPEWESELELVGKPIIYVPLQMFPEATVDYWCNDLDAVDYDNTLLRLIEHFSKDFHFLIKEHPNVLGFRNPAIYQKLASYNNVVFCSTHVNSNRLVELSDAVLVWTGTVGFEAALRGKPVLALCDAYYMSGRKFRVITPSTSASEIRDFIECETSPLSVEEKRCMVEFVLSGLLPGRYTIDGSWNPAREQDVQDARRIGESLRVAIPVNLVH